ncbi:MAG: hypothetical protein FWD49_04715 [Firmicutes bacterium]|nr:hypothetical protein [Bacillota bacterium]
MAILTFNLTNQKLEITVDKAVYAALSQTDKLRLKQEYDWWRIDCVWRSKRTEPKLTIAKELAEELFSCYELIIKPNC